MVNAHPDGTHGYRLIQEAEAELVAYLTTPEAAPQRQPEQEPVALVKHMVNRFLGWKLPADFHPDGGISVTRERDYEHPQFGCHKYEPIGTNLLTADQATMMFEYCIDGYTHPPRREWRGLTDEEAKDIAYEVDANGGYVIEFYRAIEAKLKELNHE
jgi:hypothetical protein